MIYIIIKGPFIFSSLPCIEKILLPTIHTWITVAYSMRNYIKKTKLQVFKKIKRERYNLLWQFLFFIVSFLYYVWWYVGWVSSFSLLLIPTVHILEIQEIIPSNKTKYLFKHCQMYKFHCLYQIKPLKHVVISQL